MEGDGCFPSVKMLKSNAFFNSLLRLESLCDYNVSRLSGIMYYYAAQWAGSPDKVAKINKINKSLPNLYSIGFWDH